MSNYLHSDDFLKDFAMGDAKAFKAMHTEYFPKLTALAAKITMNYCEGEDIAIDALAKLMLSNSKFVYGNFTRDHLKNHLYLSVRNRCFDYLESFRRTTRASSLDADTSLDNLFVESIEESIMYAEVVDRLNRSLQELPEDQRTALELVYFQNKKVKDAAEQMQVSLSTFKNIRERAFKGIYKKVPDKGIITSVLAAFTYLLRP